MDVDDEVSAVLQGGSCFAVEFPGYIEDVDRALSTMGGIQGLQEQRKSRPKTLTLKLRPEDDFCHPIVSNDVKKSSKMLLRLDKSGNATICTIPQVYYFRSPADLQIQGGERYLESDRAFFAPPVFQVEGAVEYAIEAYGADRETGAEMYKNVGLGMIVLDYDIPHVPKDEEGFFDVGTHAVESTLSRVGHCLKDIFKTRPIFMNEALLSELKTRWPMENLADDDVNAQLTKLCYRFASGPWRSSWIRKGYDPRKDIQSSRYHVMTLSHRNVGMSSDEDHEEHIVSDCSYKSLCSLELPKNDFCVRRVHLMDIDDDGIRQRLRKSLEAPSRTCTEECGWHVEFPLSKMSDRIREILEQNGSTDVLVQYYEPRDNSKHCLDVFHSKIPSIGALPKSAPISANKEEFFDILPDEYHETIASNLTQKK